METNPPSQENSDQVVIISYTTHGDDDQLQQGGQRLGQVRSYECTFCKRGFSNAQALGGHMNIHRKDKAKLKQSSSSTTPPPPIIQPKNLPWIFADQESMDHATPTMLRHDQSTSNTHFGQALQHLPSFSTTTHNENHQESGGKGFFASSTGQEQAAMGEDNLDLELRLGHEPSQDHSSAAATGIMRKFL
ncbi:hypothetical protein RHSIM_Rhsim01G0231800 [Rhododendron simsii]|uniref:C2H2-type domain-containing protein n=1 Tax=Rhododendron simsii TaxID=118357 RepID=A0A834HKM1_RHOSS|nr:hypothetical protein RHSIM_Rhsim01G0231800 [Rhododendron simsii]